LSKKVLIDKQTRFTTQKVAMEPKKKKKKKMIIDKHININQIYATNSNSFFLQYIKSDYYHNLHRKKKKEKKIYGKKKKLKTKKITSISTKKTKI
jgi:hypothetical protein